jgi:hypothetical protein
VILVGGPFHCGWVVYFLSSSAAVDERKREKRREFEEREEPLQLTPSTSVHTGTMALSLPNQPSSVFPVGDFHLLPTAVGSV